MQSGATYLFDLASAAGAEQEDRTVAAWTVTPDAVGKRDVSYQRGFPLAADPGNPKVDRGHLIPHLSGGEFGPNIFRQDRALNRGWSDEGRRFRALEREAASGPGIFYFGHLLYEDDTAYPMEIEIGILRGGLLHVERFQNRFSSGRQPAHGDNRVQPLPPGWPVSATVGELTAELDRFTAHAAFRGSPAQCHGDKGETI